MGKEKSTSVYQTSILTFCLVFKSGPNTEENLLGVYSKFSKSGIMEIEERKYPGKKRKSENETKFRILHISEYYTKQHNFFEVRSLERGDLLKVSKSNITSKWTTAMHGS